METSKYEIEQIASKMTMEFEKRFYVKYDVFEFAGLNYLCVSMPRQLENGHWAIDVIPYNGKIQHEDQLVTRFITNSIADLYECKQPIEEWNEIHD